MEKLQLEAKEFLDEMNRDAVATAWIPDANKRWEEIKLEIQSTGTYSHTHRELVFGARLAWRNSNRCIGRHFWRTLNVQDARNCTDVDGVVQRLKQHVDLAFNHGKIANVITVFPPAQPGNEQPWRLLNHQLIRYAGFDVEHEGVKGDPDSLELTRYCQDQGWRGTVGDWTPLPWVLVKDGEPMPPVDPFYNGSLSTHEIFISHPDFPQTSDLGLRWYSIPILTDMALKIGGIVYPLAPFNGHYLGTEIAARNLTDPDRYNVLETWAQACNIDTKKKRALWQDEALVRLNQALLSSFDDAGVTVGDHHELGRAFEAWCQAEQRDGRDVPGDWSWLTPPMSGSLTPQFHRQFANGVITHTNFFYQDPVQVKGMTYESTAKETHRMFAHDAFEEPSAPAKCPFSSLTGTLKKLWR